MKAIREEILKAVLGAITTDPLAKSANELKHVLNQHHLNVTELTLVELFNALTIGDLMDIMEKLAELH